MQTQHAKQNKTVGGQTKNSQRPKKKKTVSDQKKNKTKKKCNASAADVFQQSQLSLYCNSWIMYVYMYVVET